MKILFDARSVTQRKTGIGTYIDNLLKVLQKYDQKNSYSICTAQLRHSLKVKRALSSIVRLFLFIHDNFIFPFFILLRRADIYHNPAFILPLLNFRYKKIITIHDLGFYVFGNDFATGWHARHLRFMLPITVRKADKIIAVSESTKRQIKDIFAVPDEKITVVYEGVTANYRQIQGKGEVEEILIKYKIRKPYVLFVGTMDPRKNIERLIRAFVQVKRDYQELSLVVVGNKGELFSPILQKLVQEKGIILTGYVAEEDLVYLYNGAEVFAFPSLYEGFGLPILEAMACGTPVLTANRYSLPEVAGDAALLVDPENIEQITAALKSLLGDSSLQQELRAKGLARARQFTWERAALATVAIYNEVAGEK